MFATGAMVASVRPSVITRMIWAFERWLETRAEARSASGAIPMLIRLTVGSPPHVPTPRKLARGNVDAGPGAGILNASAQASTLCFLTIAMSSLLGAISADLHAAPPACVCTRVVSK